ncbi:zinc ribbon domain-containing protein [bacterium]|nr:zinc ribbon domain-containing protein [bacterium]
MNNNEKLAKVAVNKSLLKEYSNDEQDRIVYMEDGTEFQIQVFNPYNYVIGVSLNFNNDFQGNSNLLVLRPGERVWLERYLDNESRFLFSTYKVSNSQSVKEAIKDNGNLCIKFFKEQTIHWINNNIYYEPYISYYNDNYKIYNTNISNIKNGLNSCINNNYFSQNLGSFNGTSITTSCSSAEYTCSTASTLSAKDLSDNTKKSKSVETGRIEEGRHSNQKFKNVNKNFDYFPFKTEYIKILPLSQKQITSNDLQKKYCHECGRKLNQKYKFCPYCGAKQ